MGHTFDKNTIKNGSVKRPNIVITLPFLEQNDL